MDFRWIAFLLFFGFFASLVAGYLKIAPKSPRDSQTTKLKITKKSLRAKAL